MMKKFPSVYLHLSVEGIKTNNYALAFAKNSIFTARMNEG